MIKRIISIIAAITLILLFSITAFAAPPYDSYTYNSYMLPVQSPVSHIVDREITGVSLGVGKFNEPSDFCVDRYNKIYILDSANKRVVVLNDSYECVAVIDRFIYADNEDIKAIEESANKKLVGLLTFLNRPQGIFVDDSGMIFIADTDNNRIVKCDINGSVVNVFRRPDTELLDANTPYQPNKIIADKAGRIFILATNVNKGILQLNAKGEFVTFFGAPKVSFNILYEILKRISTKEQRKSLPTFVPTEYANLSIDSNGFIYVVANAIDKEQLKASFTSAPGDGSRERVAAVKKLSANGADILTRMGLFPQVGDLSIANEKNVQTIYQAQFSMFVDVASSDYGYYSCLDYSMGHVFTYDGDGNLLFVFGGKSAQKGCFREPVAIGYMKDKIIVADKQSASLTVFKPTDYGKTILAAVCDYVDGNYDQSEQEWVKALKMNANLDQAYLGMGKSLMRSGNYKEAMENFEIANAMQDYSTALSQYMKETIGSKFMPIFLVICAVFLLWGIWKVVKRIRLFFKEGVNKVV